MRKDIEKIQAEAGNERHSANKPETTFAYKWMTRAYRLTVWVDVFAAVMALCQIALFAFIADAPILPGLNIIYSAAMVISAAFVGGEEIVGRIMEQGGSPDG